MDIFTTALTRVVPVPIKPEQLKVKALLKEARTRGLEQEMDHLEHAGSFFIPGYHPEQNQENAESRSQDHDQNAKAEKQAENVNAGPEKSAEKPDDEPPHLDIFV
ncbi:hypothetical protein SG34_019350 [Thalassomonas viridans]|uniref:Uncharacterized protein n=1 Tax=Thalassomonas viridans TaxID=137584 RepID=A0AAE9Z1K3_9GAMM|nr:hypothetical protein [Thalassomonas viridans]WDE03533.1 hypothetical protein SG34_019350 [Thalassomonas viridans]